MRNVLSLVMTLFLIAPGRPAGAQATTVRDLPLPGSFDALSASISMDRVIEQESDDDAVAAERVGAVLRWLKPDTKIKVHLRSGETVEGRLTDVIETSFGLYVRREKAQRPHTGTEIKQRYTFDQVDGLTFPGSKNCYPPKKAREIVGKRVEVLLMKGDTIRGRLDPVTDGTVSLVAGDERSVFSSDEVASVRKLGMPTVAKVLILVGVSFAVGTGLAIAALASAL